MMRPNEAQDILRRLTKAYRVTLDEQQAVIYAEALAPFDLDVAMFAVKHWIDTEQWLPKVSELRAACNAEKRRTAAVTTLALEAPKRTDDEKQRGLEHIADVRSIIRRAPEPPKLIDEPLPVMEGDLDRYVDVIEAASG